MMARRALLVLGLALALVGANAQINLGTGAPVACGSLAGQSLKLKMVMASGMSPQESSYAHPYAVCFSGMTVTVAADCSVEIDTTADIPTDVVFPTTWSKSGMYPNSELQTCPGRDGPQSKQLLSAAGQTSLFGAMGSVLQTALWPSLQAVTVSYTSSALTCGTAGVNCGVLVITRGDGLVLHYLVTGATGAFASGTMAPVDCITSGVNTQVAGIGKVCLDDPVPPATGMCNSGTYKIPLSGTKYICPITYAGAWTAAGTLASGVNICGPGTSAPSTGRTQIQGCVACTPGYYSKANQGNSHCRACDYDSWNDASNSAECFDCPPGSKAYVPGSTACVRCNGATVQVCKTGTENGCKPTDVDVDFNYATFTIVDYAMPNNNRLRDTTSCPAIAGSDTMDMFTGDNVCATNSPTDYFAATTDVACKVTIQKLADSKCSDPSNTNYKNWVLNGFYAVVGGKVTIYSQIPDGVASTYNSYMWKIDNVALSNGQMDASASLTYFTTTKNPDVVFPAGGAANTLTACSGLLNLDGGRIANAPVTDGGHQCPPGTSDLDIQITPVNRCKPCTPGKVCLGGNNAPQDCLGKAVPLFGTSKLACDAAKYCPDGQAPNGTPGAFKSGTVGGAGVETYFIGQTCVSCAIGAYSCYGEAGGLPLTTCNDGKSVNTFGQCLPCQTAEAPATTTCALGATNCQAGKVWNPTSAQCEACLPGQYKPSATATSCMDCPAGTFNPALTTVDGLGACLCAPDGVTTLAAGCPAPGKTEADRKVVLEPGNIEMETCQNGAIAVQVAGVTPKAGNSVCQPCPVGHIQVANECKACGSGPAGSLFAAGTYRPGGVATINSNRCLKVPPGYKANSETAGSTLTLCAAGTVSFWSTASPSVRTPTQADQCSPCKTNTFAAKDGQVRCVLCRAGSQTIDTGVDGNEGCSACPVRTYRSALEASGKCLPCGEGKETRVATGAVECSSCPPGWWWSATKDGTGAASTAFAANPKCQPCPVNYYQPEAGKSSCIACPAGTYTPDVGNTSCTPCEPGKYGDAPASDCKDAPKGTYTANPGQIAPTSCPVGRYTDDEGNDVCTICPAGTYANLAGSTNCKLCIAGTYSKRGASSCADCQPGYYSPAGAGACLACKPGYYNDKARAGTCIPCPIGSYCPTSNLDAPIACRAGMYSTLEAQTSCKKCPPDTYQDGTGSTSCKSCDVSGANTKGYTTRGHWGVASATGCVAPRTVRKL